MNKKKPLYKSSSTIKNVSVSIEVYPPRRCTKDDAPLERYYRCDASIKFTCYEKKLSLHYSNETIDEIFERVNNSEKGIESLMGLKNDQFVGGYSWEHDRMLLRCLLKLEDKLMGKLEKDAPPVILDGDSGAS